MSGICFFGGQLSKRFEIRNGALEFAKRIQQRANPRDFFDIALSPVAVRPKISGRHALLERV
jgi:hypothetical protein